MEKCNFAKEEMLKWHDVALAALCVKCTNESICSSTRSTNPPNDGDLWH